MKKPMKPLLIYDGDCNFCRRWINRWKSLTQEQVDYAPFQQVADQFPQIPKENFKASIQLIEPSGATFSGAEAVFRALASTPNKRWLLRAYERIPGFRLISEWFYRLVARHRVFFSAVTRFLWGEKLGPAQYFFSSWLFLKLIGLIYLIAFWSLGTQILGLAGYNGILPAKGFLEMIYQRLGPERYFFLPTLYWLNSSDFFLQFLCHAGACLSFLLVLGIAPVPILFVLWIFYLSLTVICGDFLSFQWDALLLETGFLAIFFAPLGIWPRSNQTPPSKNSLWLLRWLLFRLMFASGVVKLSSGDPTWRNLLALNYHYQTQPLPTWIGWYAHQLPAWFQKMSVLGMFFIELVVPFLIFAPRRLRYFACAAFLTLQLLIFGTGNYCFFNLLAMSLCVLLLDDEVWPAGMRKFLRIANGKKDTLPKGNLAWIRQPRSWPKWIAYPITGLILLLSATHLPYMFRVRVRWPEPIATLQKVLAPFRIVSSYGLFAVMTQERLEIIVEGSNDGTRWLPYEFKYKPGDVKNRPRFVEPHQPRLDWQMWFAALSSYRENPWFLNFCVRLLQGSPEVLALLKDNPFPNTPPLYVRAIAYDYHFTDIPTHRDTHNWWQRQLKGLYCPAISLKGKA